MTGIQFAFEDPPPPPGNRKSPLEDLKATLQKNPGRWIKVAGAAGSKHWARKAGYEVTVRGKDLYLRERITTMNPAPAPPPKPQAAPTSVLEGLEKRDEEIRRLVAEGVSVKIIARRFSVSEGRVYQIAPKTEPRFPGPSMRVVGMGSLADELDEAKIGITHIGGKGGRP